MNKIGSFILIGVILLFVSCEELKSYPPIPEVEFKDYKVDVLIDSDQQTIYKVFFRFQLTDGDGDMGLQPGDTLGVHAPTEKYYFNLFVDMYQKIGNEFVKYEPKAPNHRRIPYIEPQGQNKTLIADIEVGNDLFDKENQGYDTLMYKFHVVDKELNHSDTVFTCKIPFKEQTKGYIPEPPKPQL